jgi:small subunit ribosomal protein S3Ae
MAQTAALKKKKKDWYPIISTNDFGNKLIGETPAEECSATIGKLLTIDLVKLTGDMKRQGTNVDFIITEAKEGKCIASPVKVWMQPSSVKRLIRGGITRIDESFIVKTKDNISVRLKPLLITRAKVKGSIGAALKATAIKELTGFALNSTYVHIMQSIMSFNAQRDLKQILDKIYPLKACQLRAAEILKKTTIVPASAEAPAQPVAAAAAEPQPVKAEEAPKAEPAATEEKTAESAEEKPAKKPKKKKKDEAEQEKESSE